MDMGEDDGRDPNTNDFRNPLLFSEMGEDDGREPNILDLLFPLLLSPLGQAALPASKDSLNPKLNLAPKPEK